MGAGQCTTFQRGALLDFPPIFRPMLLRSPQFAAVRWRPKGT